ncbi:DNA-deoxyinosine glycosylase [Cloacibacillus sp. An23]|uniref:DNA-deoxyinosine glycosylase n=1 Tax=Cloacibacillus sp. An23 TaxID=1965591 RepID=UPI0013022060|nr:DNA-deoxyinosine glycosylase [Cloacibacillus sp. An23]
MKYSFGPLINENSKILILGSLPGVRSLAESRYYAHPQNKFWKIIYGAWGLTPDADFDARYGFILAHGLALWDVIKCARREGSADGSIRDETPNDVPALLATHPAVSLIIFNGGFAFAKYKKYFGLPKIEYRKMLSTSPACAGRDKEREEMWRAALRRAAPSSAIPLQ